MAEKRMFTQKIIDSDRFLDMPLSTQALYFHLNMRADDDGFVNNPKRIQRTIGASEDDLKLLIVKRFVIGFDNGVIVIKHWRMHNTLRKDRYSPTQYQEEFAMLRIKDNNSYTENPNGNHLATTWQPLGNHLATQYSIDKYSIDKCSIDKYSISPSDTPSGAIPLADCIEITDKSQKQKKEKPLKHKYGEYNNVFLTDDELDKLKIKFPDWENKIDNLSCYIESKGAKYKSHYATILNWARRETDSKGNTGYRSNIDAIQNRVSAVDDW